MTHPGKTRETSHPPLPPNLPRSQRVPLPLAFLSMSPRPDNRRSPTGPMMPAPHPTMPRPPPRLRQANRTSSPLPHKPKAPQRRERRTCRRPRNPRRWTCPGRAQRKRPAASDEAAAWSMGADRSGTSGWGALWRQSAQGWVEDPAGRAVWRPIVTTSATLSEWEVDTYLGLVTGELAISSDNLEGGLRSARQDAVERMVDDALAGAPTPLSACPWTWSRLGGAWSCRPQGPQSLSRPASEHHPALSKGRSLSGRGSPGRPSTRSAMMFICTSSVPPPIRRPGAPRNADTHSAASPRPRERQGPRRSSPNRYASSRNAWRTA